MMSENSDGMEWLTCAPRTPHTQLGLSGLKSPQCESVVHICPSSQRTMICPRSVTTCLFDGVEQSAFQGHYAERPGRERKGRCRPRGSHSRWFGTSRVAATVSCFPRVDLLCAHHHLLTAVSTPTASAPPHPLICLILALGDGRRLKLETQKRRRGWAGVGGRQPWLFRAGLVRV